MNGWQLLLIVFNCSAVTDYAASPLLTSLLAFICSYFPWAREIFAGAANQFNDVSMQVRLHLKVCCF